MPAIWNGAIGFGLVSIPVGLVTATESHDVALRQVHAADGGRIRNKRVCSTCGQEVAYEDIAKGYTAPAGRKAVLTDADMADLPLPTKRLIDVLAFVDEHTIDPLQLSRAYYLTSQAQAGAAAAKPYVLFRDTLARSGQAAVAKVTVGTRERLALIRVHREMLVLHTMYWPDEVRAPDVPRPGPEITVRPQEVQMAASLMEAMSADFDLAAEHHDYATALRQLAEAKLEGQPPPEAAEPTTTPAEGVEDLMAALQASIQAHQPPATAKKPAKKATTRRRRRTI